MSKKSATDSSRLDLGIQSLLASVESSVSSVELPTSRKIASEMNGATHSLCENEFAVYAKRNQWQELIEYAEKVISETDSPLARVWWLRGQVEMSSMPVSLLVSSFGSLCQRIQQQGEMESFSDLLVELSYLISERARSNHDAQCVEELDEILVIFELSHTGDQPGKDPAVQQVPLDTLKRQEENRFSSSGIPMLKPSRIIVAVFLSAAVLWVMFGSVKFRSKFFQHENRSALIVLTDKKSGSHFSSPTLELPDVSERVGISGLDAVKYRLNSVDVKGNPGGAVLQGSRIDTKPQIEIVTVPRRTAAVSKESVNTTGPLESREFRRGVERERSKAMVKAQLPQRVDDTGGQWPSPFGARSMVVVDATKVFRRPSDTSDILGQLLVGDKILVEGTYGRWARIRSRKGRTGYVDFGSLGQGEDFRAP